ncbi:hypothetical protein Thiowin_03688 [Thiorhodovibrio winogradskyi]|uniref:DUF433 domain-containing protein n=1 Tax=Thiorhodovibrio winogradskyi TaxID=77007 RepID=A0ABZ0SC49_9GAMM|nr:DUF433 domain-containing protein [Thiorhodovibrio winogradskyi]
MGGKACIRGLRITAGNIVSLVASGCGFDEILDAYPDLDEKDIIAAMRFIERAETGEKTWSLG